jgi:hypothetical protein
MTHHPDMAALRRSWASGLAVADGRIPDGVDPESAEGRRYAALIEHVRADVAAAPPMTDVQKALVATLLRGGRRDDA